MAAVFAGISLGPIELRAQPTAFTYQGRLQDGFGAANGAYDFVFTIFDSPTNPVPLVPSNKATNVAVANGLFTVPIDFQPNPFTGGERWLEIAVRTNGAASFSTLAPRQAVTPAPYATHATEAAALSGPLNIAYPNYSGVIYARNTGGGPAIWAETTNASAVAAINYGDGNALCVTNLGSGPSAVFMGGNVGIGTQTPYEKLSVRGMIYSMEGGFRFPDGSVQDRAAANWLENENLDTFYLDGIVGIGTDNPTNTLHLNRPHAGVSLRFQSVRPTDVGTPFYYVTNTVGQLAQTGTGNTWSGLGNVMASDNVRASQTLSAVGNQWTGYSLILTNLGFNLPANAVIAGVTVLVEGLAIATNSCDLKEISANVSLLGHASPSAVGDRLFGGFESTLAIFPGANKVWGLDWTAAQINAPQFGISLQAKGEYFSLPYHWLCYPDSPTIVQIDQIRVVVQYYLPLVVEKSYDYVMGIPEDFSGLSIMPGDQLIAPNSSANGLMLATNGYVGIRTSNPEFHLHVAGSAGKPGGGSWSTTSDARLKKNIQPLASSLEKLLALRGVNFEYIDPKKFHELEGPRIGLIAQEVEKVFPDWVETAGDGYKRLTVGGFEALAIEALRELRAEKNSAVEQLNRQLTARDAELAALKDRMAALEKTLKGGKELP